MNYRFVTYFENALTVGGSDSRAAAYICIADKTGRKFWGVGMHDDIIAASVNGIACAINRMNEADHFLPDFKDEQ